MAKTNQPPPPQVIPPPLPDDVGGAGVPTDAKPTGNDAKPTDDDAKPTDDDAKPPTNDAKPGKKLSATIRVPLGPPERAAYGHLPTNITTKSLGTFYNVEEKLAFARIKQGLIDESKTLPDGRPVNSNMDVLRWLVCEAGGVSPRKSKRFKAK